MIEKKFENLEWCDGRVKPKGDIQRKCTICGQVKSRLANPLKWSARVGRKKSGVAPHKHIWVNDDVFEAEKTVWDRKKSPEEIISEKRISDFEEKFPSLRSKWKKANPKSSTNVLFLYDIKLIQSHCIDKQRVMGVLKKYLSDAESNMILKDHIETELELVGN